MNQRYESAKQIYARYGVDTEAAISKLSDIRISMHCWQADDVLGFENNGPLTGGIQTTGNYPGRATGPDQLFADLEKALSLIPDPRYPQDQRSRELRHLRGRRVC